MQVSGIRFQPIPPSPGHGRHFLTEGVFLSLPHVTQDEEYGGFGGPHCMLRGGYGQVTQGLASGLDVRLGCPVTSIKASENSVVVTSASGDSPLLANSASGDLLTPVSSCR